MEFPHKFKNTIKSMWSILPLTDIPRSVENNDLNLYFSTLSYSSIRPDSEGWRSRGVSSDKSILKCHLDFQREFWHTPHSIPKTIYEAKQSSFWRSDALWPYSYIGPENPKSWGQEEAWWLHGRKWRVDAWWMSPEIWRQVELWK